MKAEAISRLAVALGVLALAPSPVLPQTSTTKDGQSYSVTTGPDGGIHITLAPSETTLTPAEIKAVLLRKLPLIGSSLLQRKLAEHLGLTSFAGKPLREPTKTSVPTDTLVPTVANEINHVVSGDSQSIHGEQTEPSIAVNPIDPSIVVVGGQNTDNFSGISEACSVYLSFDGGQSFFYDGDTALFEPTPFCLGTAVRFSPDGTHLYISYIDIDPSTFNTEAAIQIRDGFNPGSVLTHISLTASAPDVVDKSWVDVHTWDAAGLGAGKVYWTFTLFQTVSIAEFDCDIVEITFSSYGSLADAINFLANSTTCGNPVLTARVLQGSRAAAGPGPQVLVCWFDAGPDGWSTEAQGGEFPLEQGLPATTSTVAPLNKFNIACRTSNDRGLTFAGGTNNPEATPGSWLYAAKGIANEVAFWMGPPAPINGNANFFRYVGDEFPSMTIDHTGTAHIVVGFNPIAGGRRQIEQGNVAYMRAPLAAITSTSPFLYPKWTRMTVAGGFGAQFFPTVTSQKVWESTKPYIYVGWLDTSASATLGPGNANLIYDVRYKRSTNGGVSFGLPTLVSDHASLSDFNFIGDYIDSTANAGIYQIVWTDNRFAADIMHPREHFFSDRY